MNRETYDELVSLLPADPGWWEGLKDFSDQDLIRAIPEIMRAKTQTLDAVIAMLDRIRGERIGRNQQYVPRDLADPTDKSMASDTFRAIIDGLSTGPAGISDEMRRLADRYPKKRDWFLATAFLVEQDHREVIERDDAINGAHKCPTQRKVEVVTIQAEKACQKCNIKIQSGLWCSVCREALYANTEGEAVGGETVDGTKAVHQVPELQASHDGVFSREE